MSKGNTYRVMISGGGTGGHIYPAIAIASAIQTLNKESEILFVGAKGKMEMEKVPAAGYQIVGLWISGIQRRLTVDNLLFPLKLIFSLLKSFYLLKKFKPNVVVGVGGYASGPLLYVASLLSIPTLIQEQNGYAGLTNKLLANRVNKICVAYDEMEQFFPKDKLVFTGNPIRKDIIELESKRNFGFENYGWSSDKKTLLVLGGSLGARTINYAILDGLEKLLNEGYQVLWQTGKFYIDEMIEKTKHLDQASLKVVPFIRKMDCAYAIADAVVSRAGALSISELCMAAKPVIFVPSPNVAEDHQTKNAKALLTKNAAWIVEDKHANEELVSKIISLMNDEEQKQILRTNIKTIAKPNAAIDIANEVILMG